MKCPVCETINQKSYVKHIGAYNDFSLIECKKKMTKKQWKFRDYDFDEEGNRIKPELTTITRHIYKCSNEHYFSCIKENPQEGLKISTGQKEIDEYKKTKEGNK
jgi:hypothetical protein